MEKVNEKKYTKISEYTKDGVSYGLYENNLLGEDCACLVVNLNTKRVLFQTDDCLIDALKTHYDW